MCSGLRCNIPTGSAEEGLPDPCWLPHPKAASRAQGKARLAGTWGPRPLTLSSAAAGPTWAHGH